MKRILISTLALAPAMLLAALLVPASAAAAGPITTAALCSSTGPAAVTCDLWAKPGTLALPGTSLTAWGYSTSAADAPTFPGPAIVLNAGDTLTLNLTNSLPQPTSLVVEGLSQAPDLASVAASGGTHAYTIHANAPGTYLYEAGILPGSEYQVSMGLYGVLVVRPIGDPVTPAGVTVTRTDAGAVVTNASSTVTDASVLATDVGSTVAGPGIPAGATVASVVVGTSFELSLPATADGTGVTMTRTDAAAQARYGSGIVTDAAALATDVGSTVTGAQIASGTTITGVTAGVSFTMSAPATLSAYGGASTAFGDEALVVVSEIDPNLSNSGTPQSFDLRKFAPKYFLVNGVAYTSAGAASIPVTAGNTLLLRYANAGILHRSMGLLGLHQRVLAADGSQLPAQRTMVAETIAPGQTADVLVTLPSTTAAETLYPVYDASLALNNSTASGIGGMIALLDATGAGGGTDTVGPLTSGVSFSVSTGALAASVSDASTGNANVAAAEYFIDAVGATGTGGAMTGAFASPTEAVAATVPAPTIAALSSGSHTVYVRGQDAHGNWGVLGSTSFTIDTTGPTTSALALTPNPASGLGNVVLSGTASDAASGNANVTAAEYTIDAGAASPMTPNTVAATVSLTATIPAATVNALTQGPHTVAVRSQDLIGNWGATTSITLNVDKNGPVTSSVAANPPANNGVTGQSTSNPSVRLSASVSDATTGGAAITAAEGFIESAGTDGTGFPFTAADGVFNASTEAVYADIPLSTINLLTSGNHTLFVHGKDAVGRWGPTTSIIYLIDRTAPTFTGITLAAVNPTNGGGISLTVNGAADPLVGGLASGVAGGEYWIDTAVPTPGTGTPFTGTGPLTIGTNLATGNHTVGVRVREMAGNWSANTASGSASTTVVAIFSNGFETGGRPWGWSSASTNTTARLNVTTTTVLSGTRSMQAQGNNTNYVQNNFASAANPAWPTYDARFQFRPNAASTGQDIFVMASATSYNATTTLARVRYLVNAGQPQVQIQVGATANASWVNINAAATNTIEVVWQAVGSVGPAPGTLNLYVNGAAAPAQTLAVASTASVATVRLGSVTSGGSSTLMYFDAFASKRSVSPLFGP